MISPELKMALLSFLEGYLKRPIELQSNTPVGGGDINRSYRLTTNSGEFFVKVNSASRFPGMFEAESKGLALLGASKHITVPQALTVGAAKDDAFLLLPFIEKGSPSNDHGEAFGRSMALLHQQSNDTFGLDHDNYIGSLHQNNQPHSNWTSFFIEERLEPQIRMARDNGAADRHLSSTFDRLFSRMENIFPEEPPALLHGDLWSGNFMIGADGQALIYDPAVYYGHREMDLGMSRLFGGFSAQFYGAYANVYPLEQDWGKRVEVANLYPLLVHVNLFGGGYLQQVQDILRRWV